MKNFVFIAILTVMFYGCCTKKACIGPAPPTFFVKFANPSSFAGSTVAIYSFRNNVKEDSIIIQNEHFEFPRELRPVFFNNGSPHLLNQFVIKTKVRTDTITKIQCGFKEVTIKCNECFPFRIEQEKEWHFENFSCRFRNSMIGAGDTIVVD